MTNGTDTSLVRRYLEAASGRTGSQTEIGEQVEASQSAVSEWYRKLANGEEINLRRDNVRRAMQDYLLRPTQPNFSEGVAYAVGSMRAMLEELEQRIALNLDPQEMDAASARGHADQMRRERGSPPAQEPRNGDP